MRTREGMAIAKAKGKLRGKQPKLSARQQAELVRMHSTGDYTIAELMEVFSLATGLVGAARLAYPAAGEEPAGCGVGGGGHVGAAGDVLLEQGSDRRGDG
jgi:hypothetical protein